MFKSIYALAILTGTIIGVGFLSLPYITSKVGIWAMLVYFLVLGPLVIFIHVLYGELSLRTPDYKRLPGFAKIHLGDWGEKIALISIILGSFGSILAYLIVGGEFLGNLLSPYLGGDNFVYILIYFIAGALLIFFGVKAIAKIEFWALILFFIALAIIFLKGKNLINIDNLSIGNWELDIGNLFLPYGPILFSLWGAGLIPEVEEMMRGRKNLVKPIIASAVFIPIIVYLFFIYLILGVSGSQTTESAFAGLGNFLGRGVVNLGFLIGILATFTSFIAIGLTLKNLFEYDLKIGKNLSWLITCFTPLFLFLIGLKSFILVISFIGGIMLGIEGILILLMYKKIKPQNVFVYPLILIFLTGIIYEIIYFIK